MSKEGIVARQFLLGVVQTAEGPPIHHEAFDGNASEGPTPLPVLKRVLQRFTHIRRLVLVADRGLLSLDNLKALEELDVARSTVFRWRHRFLALPQHLKAGHFSGIVEADETCWLKSCKG